MSGDPPVKAVVSRKSGHIFEQSVISKFILETGRCPITGQELGAGDLIELKGIYPRPSPHRRPLRGDGMANLPPHAVLCSLRGQQRVFVPRGWGPC